MARNLSQMLPAGWGGYSPARKIDWFNSVGATVSELETAGVPRSDIDYMIANGFQPGATEKDSVVEDHIAELFRTYLGREPDLEGGNFYERQFGNEVDRDELSRFLYGAVGAGEITQRQASEFLNPVVKEVQGKEVAITPDVQDKIDLYNEYADDGLTNAEILAKAEELFGEQTQEDLDILRDLALQDRVNEQFGGVTQENINDVVKAATDLGLNTEQIAAALGGTVTTAGEQKTLNLNAGQVGKTVAASFSPEEIREYIAATYGRLTQDNINDLIKETTERNIPLEDVVSAIGGKFVTGSDGKQSIQFTPNAALTAFQQAEDQIAQLYRQEFGRAPDAEGLNFYAAQLAEGKSLADIQAEIDASEEGARFDTQLQQLINTQYGGFGGANSQEIVNELAGKGYSLTQIADAIGADITTNERGETTMSYTPPAAPAKTFTNEQVQKLITDQFGSVTPDNFQNVVDAVIGAGVPVDQFASVVGATISTNDAGQTSLTLPAPETQPLSLVDQLKAQQAAIGITHQASFSKDQNEIIADMADKLGKYGVQDLTDLKPITGEVEYLLDERMDNGEPTGVFNLMQRGIGPEGEEQWQYAGRTATSDEINQIRTKGTVTENVGVLNARTGEEIPLNKLNNAEGSGFTYYKIEFSPDGIPVPYGYKEATGAGALGDQIKSIISIPAVSAALSAFGANYLGPMGTGTFSAPVAAAVSAGTVGYTASGRLDAAAKAAATAFGVSYALQSLGLDLNADQAARVDAVKNIPGYDSFSRTVDLGGGLSYDPVSNNIFDSVNGTITDAGTGEVSFTDAKNIIYDPVNNEYSIKNPDGTTNYYNTKTGEVTTQTTGTARVPTLAELNAKVFGDEFTGTEYGESSTAATGTDTTTNVKSPITTAKGDVVVTGNSIPATGVFNLLPVNTVVTNPTNGNLAKITITANGTKQITDIGSATGATANILGGTGGTETSKGTVEITAPKGDTDNLGGGLSGYEYVFNPLNGRIEVVKVTETKTGTDQGAGSGAAGAAGAATTTKTSVTKTIQQIASGEKDITDLTSDEIEALLKAGFTASLLLGGGAESPTIPTTNVDIEGINTRRTGFTPDLTPTIPPGSTTTTTPGQTVYTNLGINTGKPTSPTTPTTGIGSLPVPTYKPPPFLGAQAPGASRITPPVLTADPTFTQADFTAAAKDIATQQAALPPIVQVAPSSPFESGLAKGTTVAKRAGGIVALRGGGIPLFQMGGPVAFAYGGMTAPVNEPRMLSGGGDGMSDSIPATINGTQPARLADGEFVIPADVVSDIGNGSSKAGAKELYAMMDRVRQSRHGTTKQPPEVNMDKVLPV